MKKLIIAIAAAAVALFGLAAPATADDGVEITTLYPPILNVCGRAGFTVQADPSIIIATSASPSIAGDRQYVEFVDGETVYGFGRVDIDYQTLPGYVFDEEQLRSQGIEGGPDYARVSFTLRTLPSCDAPPPVTETPTVPTPTTEQPSTETPSVEQPTTEAPVVTTPVVTTPPPAATPSTKAVKKPPVKAGKKAKAKKKRHHKKWRSYLR